MTLCEDGHLGWLAFTYHDADDVRMKAHGRIRGLVEAFQ